MSTGLPKIYPQNFSQKTGFDQIREMVDLRCISEMGKRHAEQLSFSCDFDLISRQLKETREFLTIIETGMPFPAQDYLDLSPALLRVQVPGTYLDTEELVDLRLSLVTIMNCLAFFRKPAAQEFIHLRTLAGDLDIPVEILRETERILDEKGNIRDNASTELARIRKEMISKAVASEKLIGQLMSQARNSGWTSPDADVTISDGRLVIPILATHKRRIKGIIHDESASGQTVFLEPESCLEINNEIRELEGAERREIIRILVAFSDLIRPEIATLLLAYDFLGILDFIRAKALLAFDLDADEPKLNAGPVINWINARHPLLFMALKAKNKTIVPLNIKLDREERILIITGPNAGGKSVCLKTAGLIQYMLQCGLLIPVDPDTDAGIFQNLFIDIGDEQSLENDLSTYSSHLLNLAYFIENCDPTSLFMIDELGTGTDPSLGGAIAEAALEKLSTTGAFGVVTTHYSNLKLLSGKVPGIMNGAMLFDTRKLQPLYILASGKPGSSFTFEIARRIGFPEDVIETAMSKTGKGHLDFERQLQEVEAEKLHLEKQLKKFQVADGFLGELIEKYETMKAQLEKERREILDKAKLEARELLDQSNKAIENTIKQIREAQAEKDKTKSARSGLEVFRQNLASSDITSGNMKEKPVKEIPKQDQFKPGDWVSETGSQRTGVIQRIKSGEALVDFDGIRFTLPLSRLKPVKSQQKKTSGISSPYLRDLNEKSVNFKLTLDLRGKLADEAIQMVQKYLDDAYLLRIKEVSILHGKGEGVLRRVIRDYLSHSEEVVSFEDEQPDRGGSGITRVVLK
jgi:DNA mismatch repair protein MutS2